MNHFKEKYLTFIKLEKKYVDLKVNDEYVWPYFRNKIIGLLHMESFKDNSATQINQNYTNINQEKLMNNIKTTDVLVFLFNRFHYDDELNVRDNTTDLICDYLKKNNLSHEKVIFKNETMFETPKGYYDIVDIEIEYSKLLKKRINLFKHIDLINMSNEISSSLNIDFNAKDYVHEISAKIKSYHKMIGQYYDKIKPKYVIVTSNYMRNEIISAAKKRNIKVIECQYAAITDYHTGYHYDNIEVPYYPDYLLTWGEYFTEYENYPLNCQVITVGKYQEKTKKQIEKKTLIVSQNFIAKTFQEETIKLALKFPSIQFIYRKHPNEKLNDTFIDKINKVNNVALSENSLIKDLSFCNNVISSSSTVIYDALNMNKKVYLIDSYLSIFSEKLKYLGLVSDIETFDDGKEINLKKGYIYSEPKKEIHLFSDVKRVENVNTSKNKVHNLSIIIPTYNCEKTIKDTLLSIYQADYEIKIIVVDDKSTDNTLKIVDEMKKYMPIDTFSTEINTGDSSMPRNIGLMNSKTEYVYFLDSDDICIPSVLLESLKIAEKKQLDFIKFKAVIKTNSENSVLHPGRKFGFKENSSLKNSPFVWNAIYKTKIIKDNNIMFTKGISEDLVFNLNYFNHVKKYQFFYKIGIIYQKYNSSVSTNLSYNKYMLLLDNHLRSKKIIEENYSQNMKNFFLNEVVYKMLLLDNDYYNFIKLNLENQELINEKLSIILDCPITEIDETICKWIRKNYYMKYKLEQNILTLSSNLSEYTCDKIECVKSLVIDFNAINVAYGVENIVTDNIVFKVNNILFRTKVKGNKIIIKSYKNRFIIIIIRLLFGDFFTKKRKRMIKLLMDII